MFVKGYLIASALALAISFGLFLLGFPLDIAFTIAVVIGLGMSLFLGAFLIRIFTKPLADELGAEPSGLTNGGLYIGYLERALIMLLVLMGEPTGVGFLIAAKSILRFGEVKEIGQRKMSEYIIIGTFFSFGWGLFIALLTQVMIEALSMALR